MSLILLGAIGAMALAATIPGDKGAESSGSTGFPPPESPDLTVERLEIPGSTGTLYGTFAQPGGGGTHPGILLIHDRNGDDPHNQDMTRRLASAGYAVLLVDLYSRAGGTAKASAEGKPVYEAAPIQPAEALADLSTGLDWLRQQASVAAGQLGVVGFCMGGRYALLLAERRPDVKAAVVYYGTLGAQKEIDPLADVGNVKGALLGHFGEEDPIIPLDQVQSLEGKLKEAGIRSAVHVYSGAGHAFSNDRSPQAYRPEAAALAWERTLEWFGNELGG